MSLVDRAEVDGQARVRLLSGFPEGEVLLAPPLTGEDLVDMLVELYQLIAS